MIVIPMAGLSRRFSEAGYTVPKYMLPAHGKSVFAHAVSSFEAYFRSEPFLFIVRDVAGTPGFVRRECAALGITDARIVILDAPTGGQAETVALGLRQSPVDAAAPVTVFNIDTFRPGFRHADFGGIPADGYLEVFRGSGDNWSYVRPAAPDNDLVMETAEKQPISDLCCTGLYHFDSAETYLSAYEAFYNEFIPNAALRERYIAPIYNELIKRALSIRYTLVQRSELILCGIPDEYEAFLRRRPSR
jgi:MobA-like NTP transferase domain